MVRPELSSSKSLSLACVSGLRRISNRKLIASSSKQYLLKTLELNSDKPVPDLLNATFHNVDKELANLASQKGSSSGCTAAVAFLRLEDESGRPLEADADADAKKEKDNTAPETNKDPATGNGLWGKISKRFESADGKSSQTSPSTPRRVLYTANVGDARAVLW